MPTFLRAQCQIPRIRKKYVDADGESNLLTLLKDVDVPSYQLQKGGICMDLFFVSLTIQPW